MRDGTFKSCTTMRCHSKIFKINKNVYNVSLIIASVVWERYILLSLHAQRVNILFSSCLSTTLLLFGSWGRRREKKTNERKRSNLGMWQAHKWRTKHVPNNIFLYVFNEGKRAEEGQLTDLRQRCWLFAQMLSVCS